MRNDCKKSVLTLKLAGILVAAGLVLGGCATISENTHAYIGSPLFPPTNPNTVQVFASEPAQPKDKERLGEIILSVDGNPSRADLERKLRQAAAKLGATGVYVASDRTHIYPIYYWDWYGPMADEEWHRLIVGIAFRPK